MTPLEWGPLECHTYDTKNGCELQTRHVPQTFTHLTQHIFNPVFAPCSEPQIICVSFSRQLYTYCLQAAVCNMMTAYGSLSMGFSVLFYSGRGRPVHFSNKPYRLIFMHMTLKTQRKQNCRECVLTLLCSFNNRSMGKLEIKVKIK